MDLISMFFVHVVMDTDSHILRAGLVKVNSRLFSKDHMETVRKDEICFLLRHALLIGLDN